MRKLLLLSLVFGLGVLSCNSGVEIEDIKAENLYAVSSWISPQDTLLNVYLFKANPLGTVTRKNSSLVKNALVLISDGINNDTLHFDPTEERYKTRPTNIKIEALKQYSLKIEIPTGELLEASCNIPPTPPLPVVSGSREEDNYVFSVGVESAFGHRYYSLVTWAEGTVEYQTSDPERPVTKSNLRSELLGNIKFPADFQSDAKQFDGIVPRAYLAETPKLYVSLHFIEESLFKYLKDYQFYDQWQKNNSGTLFPNFQESKPIYSNIKGGVGIFAGYNQSTVIFDL